MKKIDVRDEPAIVRNVLMSFMNYYKFTFYYSGNYSGRKFSGIIGGSADDIYRLELKKEMTLEELFLLAIEYDSWCGIFEVEEGEHDKKKEEEKT